jgi:hypothetical protein
MSQDHAPARAAVSAKAAGGKPPPNSPPVTAVPSNFNLLVFIPSPSRTNAKRLRALIDIIGTGNGDDLFHAREKVDLARSFVPIILGPGAETAITDSVSAELKTELGYYSEVFGGLGFWPVPAANSKAGTMVREAILSIVFAPPQSLGKIVPYDDSIDDFYTSLPLRLFWQFTVLAVIAGVFAYLVAAVSDRTRKIIAWTTLTLAVLAIAVFFFLLYFDPAFYTLSQGNIPLAVLAVTVLATIYVGLRRPVIRAP